MNNKAALQRAIFAMALMFISFVITLSINAEEGGRIFKHSDSLDEIRSKIEKNGFQFQVDHNWVYDMSPEEKEKFFSRKRNILPSSQNFFYLDGSNKIKGQFYRKALPSTFDWRDHNGESYIGPVRDQSDCGACYAFGAAAAAEGVFNAANGLTGSNAVDFSESYIAWCLGTYGNYSDNFSGCEGADYEYAELEALTREGITYEEYFPYQIDDPGSCTHNDDPKVVFNSWGRTGCNDIEAMKSAIMTYGVMDAAVFVTSAFEAYSGGIFEDGNTGCPDCEYTDTNHAIALVGWNDNGDAQNSGYWILRNSWGESWGEDGYMRIKYNSAAVACAGTYLVYECDPTLLTLAINEPDSGFLIEPGTSQAVTVELRNCEGVLIGANVTVSFSSGDALLNLYDDGMHNDGGATDGVYGNIWVPVGEEENLLLTVTASKSGYEDAQVTVPGTVTNNPPQCTIQDFESGIMPPSGWELVSRSPETWNAEREYYFSDSFNGDYVASIYYDDTLAVQDEIIFSEILPADITGGSVSFYSLGSRYWGISPYDNYDLEVWLVAGEWDAGSGNDVLLAIADDDWFSAFEWVKSDIDFSDHLSSIQSIPGDNENLRIAFRYYGADGDEAALDNISICVNRQAEEPEPTDPDLSKPDASVILKDEDTEVNIESGTAVIVYGNHLANTVNVASGSHCQINNFPGANTINIASPAVNFTVKRSGAMVVFFDDQGNTLLRFPVNSSHLQTINFSDRTVSAGITGNKVMIGTQVINLTEALLSQP
ncbi:putative Cathepsin H [Desulfamplus magnetovallimortis]|uniref:Putative Cathepsin H n=1 Tax=Desulfamplus magnetovallimortis TaxID=1246637 RepID=A0A1W1HLE9_9BACT|nr:C1 family peptidase [Desulfamplus magnetovallimortis]SLM33255.1 putative Cathepsin H [Desulfamplus magnetovallimortis]